MQAWVTDRFKLVQRRRGVIEVYDLLLDPAESRPLSEQDVDLGSIKADFAAWLATFD